MIVPFSRNLALINRYYNRIRHNRASPQRHVLLPKPLPIRLQPPRNRNPPTLLFPRRNQTRRVTKQLHLPARLHRRDTADHPARPHGPLPGGPPRRRADRRTRRPRGIPRRHQRIQPPPSSGLFPPAERVHPRALAGSVGDEGRGAYPGGVYSVSARSAVVFGAVVGLLGVARYGGDGFVGV